jgi:hypothetical protein
VRGGGAVGDEEADESGEEGEGGEGFLEGAGEEVGFGFVGGGLGVGFDEGEEGLRDWVACGEGLVVAACDCRGR